MPRLTHRAFLALVAAIVAVPLFAGCSGSDPLTADNIRQRVADAMREAETFHFSMEYHVDSEPRVYKGKVSYGDDGAIQALSMRNRAEGTYRLVDNVMYHRPPGGEEFEQVDRDTRSDVVQAWDWANAFEKGQDVISVTKRGEEKIAGVSTTRYELELQVKDRADVTNLVWISDEDLLMQTRMSAKGEGWRESQLTRYGEPVDISVPGK